MSAAKALRTARAALNRLTTGSDVSAAKLVGEAAAQVVYALPPATITTFGQSNEHGLIDLVDRANFPQAFQSLLNRGMRTPLAPSVNRLGGYHLKMVDELAGYGINAYPINAAVPSLSFLQHTAGYLKTRQNSTAYAQRRPPSGPGDCGDAGDFILFTGPTRVFRCTKGAALGAFFNNAENSNPTAGGSYQTTIAQTPYILGTSTAANPSGIAAASASSLPAGFATAAIGDVVVDGTLEWTRENEALYATALGNNSVMTLAGQPGRGHDRLNVIGRGAQAMKSMRASRNIALLANGQSDLGVGAPTYQAAIQSIAETCIEFGFDDVLIGLTNWSPGSSGATTTAYNNLSTGVDNAIAALSAKYPGRIGDGGNLFRLMGTTGPMAAGGAFLKPDNIHLSALGNIGPMTGGVECAGVHRARAVRAHLLAYP